LKINSSKKITRDFQMTFKFSRLFIKTRHIIIVIAVLILLFVSQASYALDTPPTPNSTSVPEKDYAKDPSYFGTFYNSLYQFINEHEYLVTPLAGAVAGGYLCGPWCIVIGGTAGAIDETLNYFEVTDKRYLTWVIIGTAFGYTAHPTLAYEIAGGAVGFLVITGNGELVIPAIAPTMSAIAGNTIAGVPGAIIGLAVGIFDEMNTRNGNTEHHELTFECVGMAITNSLVGSNPIAAAVMIPIGGFIGFKGSEQEKEITTAIVDPLLGPIKTVQNLYTTYGKFIPKEQLDTFMERQAIALFTCQFLTHFLSTLITQHSQDLTNGFEHLNDPNVLVRRQFVPTVVSFIMFSVPYAIGSAGTGIINNYFQDKFQYAFSDQIRSKLFSGETALRLSYHPDANLLLNHLNSDISTMVGSGSGLVTGGVSSTINGIYGLGIIVFNSPRIFIYSTMYNKMRSFISDPLTEKVMLHNEQITVLGDKYTAILNNDIENIRTITERGGLAASRAKTQQLVVDLRKLQETQNLWGSVNGVWGTVSGITDAIFTLYLVGDGISNGIIAFEDRIKVRQACPNLLSTLAWPSDNKQTVEQLNKAINRINIVEANTHEDADSRDQINRTTEESNQLILQDLEIGFKKRVLVNIEDLRLDMGKVYVLTGEEGCGKSKLISKIYGLKENGVSGKGNIYYPQINGEKPKIILLSQRIYFPLDSSLQEVLSYPDTIPSDPKLNEEQRKNMCSLLKEIGLKHFSDTDTTDDEVLTLDSKQHWPDRISGGEQAKMLLVSAMLQKPDILLLDETFTGISDGSLPMVQRALKKQLPNTLIIVIDHKAKTNNYNSFYDKELYFDVATKTIMLREIASVLSVF